MASLMFVLQALLYEAVAIYAPAIALAAVTNMQVWMSILTVAAIGSVYTAIVSAMRLCFVWVFIFSFVSFVMCVSCVIICVYFLFLYLNT